MTPLAFLLSRQLSFALAVSLVGARAAAQAPIAAPASAVPPDSVRPKPVVSVVEPPANAVARCTDGAFVIAPSDAATCAAHGGLRVVFPRRAAPRPAVAATPSLVAQPATAVAPAGATMRCKDGTYLGGVPTASRCARFGGVAAVLAAPPKPPPMPRPRRP